MPKVSVVMPVYNGEKYLKEAIDSILNQTFTNFEFIIINDCSTDFTEDIIKSYKDIRIRYVKNSNNLGVAESLNKGFKIAEGEYIARMDADDISLPQRFEKQVEFLDNHHGIAVCGCEVELFGDVNQKNTYTVFGREEIKINLLFSSCFCHPATMFRRNVIVKENYYYDTYYDKIEDYELWTRIIMDYDMDNIHGTLFRYRIHGSQVTQNYSEKHMRKLKELKEKQLKQLGIEFTRTESKAFFDFCRNKIDYDEELLDLAFLIEKLYEKNSDTKFFNEKKYRDYLKGILMQGLNKQKTYKISDIERVCRVINRKDIIRQRIKSWIKSCIKKGN